MLTFKSDISKKEFSINERVNGYSIRKSLLNLIQHDHPNFDTNQSISIQEYNHYRQLYMADFLGNEVTHFDALSKETIEQLSAKETISDKLEEEGNVLTFGQKVADKVAEFGGSWWFIISFLTFIFIWMAVNMFLFLNKGFDPYPFILLNLILSCVAAFQAPVIMMSQSRQEEKDRARAKKDYIINLKSEIEIRMLHEKIDHLIIHQQQRLLEIQQIQIDMIEEIMNKLPAKK